MRRSESVNDRLVQTVRSHFDLNERRIGEYAELKSRGMHFSTSVFDAEEAGSLCLMDMKAFFGAMKMWTAVFSPTERDGPILSLDYIEAFGNCTLVLELYDTTLSHPTFQQLEEVKAKYASLPEYDHGEHWYNRLLLPASTHKRGKKLQGLMRQMLQEYAERYFELLKSCPACDKAEKRAKNAEFANGLLQNGGPAVDQFRKMLGEEKTAVFIRTCMFCCE